MNDQLALPMTFKEATEDRRGVRELSRGNRFRLMLGQPLLPDGSVASAIYTPWECDICKRSDLTRVQQTSKCKGTGRCYWCCVESGG